MSHQASSMVNDVFTRIDKVMDQNCRDDDDSSSDSLIGCDGEEYKEVSADLSLSAINKQVGVVSETSGAFSEDVMIAPKSVDNFR